MLVLALWAVGSALAVVLARARTPEEVAPGIAALGLLWAVGSYFVGRSHTVIVTDLLPTVLLAGLVAVRGLRPGEAAPVRTALATLVTAVLLFAAHDRSGWQSRLHLSARWGLQVDSRRALMNPQQVDLMRKAGLKPGSPIVLYDTNVLPAWPPRFGPRRPEQIWLPTQPLMELVPVSEERRALYMARFAARTQAGGWLVEDTLGPGWKSAQGAWFAEALARTHRPVEEVTVSHWRATRFEYVGE
jgi:hypothetical protein